MSMCSMPECQTTAGCMCRKSGIICDPPGWHSQDEVNDLQRRHIESVARLVARISELEREVARLNLSNQTVADELGNEITRLQRELASARSEARKMAIEEAAKVAEEMPSAHPISLSLIRSAVFRDVAVAIRRLAEQEGT